MSLTNYLLRVTDIRETPDTQLVAIPHLEIKIITNKTIKDSYLQQLREVKS